jgi:hypothetical protein
MQRQCSKMLLVMLLTAVTATVKWRIDFVTVVDLITRMLDAR